MKKSDLRPGMVVRNTVSSNTGRVIGNPDGSLTCGDLWVGIETIYKSGPKKGRKTTTIWTVANLEIVSES